MPCPCKCGTKSRIIQRQTTIQQEEQFKIELEHLFQQHGDQGVRRQELELELQETGITEVIPQKKISDMLRKADKDQDCYITYTEFMTLYTENDELSKKDKTAMRRFVGMAINNIVPLPMREDFLKNYTCSPPPVFMIIVSVLEIGMFIYYAVELSKKGVAITANTGLPKTSPLMYIPTRRYEAWRYISYMLLHQGYLHLIFNLLFQLLLGLPLEIVHKWWRLLLVYMCGVIGGSLGHSVTDHSVNLVGASGGCYALIGAHLASVIVNWKEMNYKCSECDDPVRVVTSAPIRLAILLLLAGADTGNAIYRRFFDPGGSHVGIAAHIGGLLTGLLMGVPLMKNINELPWEKKVGWATLAVYLSAVLFCILFNIFYKGYPATDHTPCC